MNSYRIFIVLSKSGIDDFLKATENIASCEGNSATLLFHPTLLKSDNNGGIEKFAMFLTWTPEKTLLVNAQKDLLSNIKAESNQDCFGPDDYEFLTDCIHQLCDELPVAGVSLVETYLFVGSETYSSLQMEMVAALKRVELWHHSLMFIVSENDLKAINSWIEMMDAQSLSVNEFKTHRSTNPMWGGSINLLMEKRSGYIPVCKSYLTLHESNKDESLDPKVLFFKNVLGKSIKTNTAFGSHIEIVACIKQEDLPFHMIFPVKYTLNSLKSSNDNAFNFFKFCSNSKANWLMAFLRYDFSKQSLTPTSTTSGWMEYIKDKFTLSLCIDYSLPRLRKHCVMFLRYSDLNKEDNNQMSNILDVYFLYNHSTFNSVGYLDLMQKCGPEIDCSTTNSSDEKLQFISNAAEYIHPADWCEKTSWYLEETTENIGKSLARLKSDEFFMNGVAITAADLSKTEQKQIFPSVLKMFDSEGKALTKNLQPIPIITDRLFKNLKTAENVKKLSYTEAEKEIGHGIDYCLDSICAVRLDSRLTKVQKRYVPDDTMNLATYIENQTPDETAVSSCAVEKHVSNKNRGVKRALSKGDVNSTNEKPRKSAKKESRSEKNRRRLRTIVDGAISKYGGIDKDDDKYHLCCEQLYKICVEELKKLKTSKGLVEQMRQLAKDNLHKVLT